MNQQKTAPIRPDNFIERLDVRIKILNKNMKKQIDSMIGKKYAITGWVSGHIIQREANHGSTSIAPIIKSKEDR